MLHKKVIFRFLGLVMLLSLAYGAQAQPDGKALFGKNCASCHNRNMVSDMTGPALGGVQERWEAAGQLDNLDDWIRNAPVLIASGNPYAKTVGEYKPTQMQAFPNLKDDEIEQILLYIDGIATGDPNNPYAKPATAGGGGEAGTSTTGESGGGNNLLTYGLLLGVLVLLAMLLGRLITNLNRMAQEKAGEPVTPTKTLWQKLTTKNMIAFITFAAVVVLGFITVQNGVDLGRQQNYQPDQPIKFSHATHAGVNKIDCQYCHDGARRSKHSIIPAANTCMNCHKAIEKGPSYGTAELTKIFASIGYNPMADSYMENYDQMSDEDIAKVYKKWIRQEFVVDNESSSRYEGQPDKLQKAAQRTADDQWDDIVQALTNGEEGNKIQGPIEWVRVHNLPDHVYFNHAQHVTVGKVECQQCHGAVEEMEILEQYAPLSMGWCINCHRQTEVQVKDNDYYKAHYDFHKDVEGGKITVEDIGGLECQKCHY